MILCAGLQSSGSTLVSWCFLQRGDTDGVLDMENDVIHTDLERVRTPIAWVKMTVGAFRWLDVAETYVDLGWRPEPLLVVRDVRTVYASLGRKAYGLAGLTADRPPLRMRLRRFLRDWTLFNERGWPILVFEHFVAQPRPALEQACDALGVEHDDAMLTWPKRLADIAYVLGDPNRTFAESLAAGSLPAALSHTRTPTYDIPLDDLAWLEETFAEYNEAHGYARHVEPAESATAGSGISSAAARPLPRRALAKEIDRLRRELIVKLDVEPVVPPGSTFILVDNGIVRLHDGDRRSFPFPERDGRYNGHPADDAEAVAELERLRRAGARFIVFPTHMRYWLESYRGLRSHLEATARVLRESERSVIYAFD